MRAGSSPVIRTNRKIKNALIEQELITIKIFPITDVHSHFPQAKHALDSAGFDKNNPEHLLLILGDLLDRGDYPRECLEFVNSIERKVCIRGNHEDLLEDAIYRGTFYSHDHHNGTFKTAMILGTDDAQCDSTVSILENTSNHPEWVKYRDSLVDYYETENYVFVHGWIPDFAEGEDWRKGDWSSARWKNGMKCWNNGERLEGKTIVCGHYHTPYGHAFIHKDGIDIDKFNVACEICTREQIEEYRKQLKFTPFFDEGIIALDSCVAYSKFINCVPIEDNLLEGDKYVSN